MISLQDLITTEKPLQIVGVINPLAARLAEQAGHRAIYLSGAGVANANFALPDLAMTSLNDVLESVRRITAASDLPLLVDVDTGWGSPINVRRTFQLISRAKAAGAHIEDQTEAKRCGHRSGKQLISISNMVGKINAALDGRDRDSFMVMARTDAIAVEGEDRALDRALAYQEAGANAIFVEAATSLTQYEKFCRSLSVPVLANITEFGLTPLFTRDQLAQVGISMILYPLSAFRAMNKVALAIYSVLRETGTQQSVVHLMQTREELYHLLNYEAYEKELESYMKNMEKDDGSV
ncbi:MAG: methylisocitrate lyase [Candidatus Berkiellales bacterium]